MQGARKNRKLAKRCVFPMVCGSEGSRSRLANAAGAERSGQMEIRNYMPLWCEADFEVKILKAPHARTTFASWDVQKCTALWCEAHFEVKCSEHFWELRRWESARRCGAKHISWQAGLQLEVAKRIVTAARKVVLDHSATLVLCGIPAGGC